MSSEQWQAINNDFAKIRKTFNSFPLNRKSGQNIGSI